MKDYKVNIPVLVTYRENSGYGIRPLLASFDTVWHKRYIKAKELFARSVKSVYSGIQIDKGSISTLLWLNFLPRYKYKVFPFEFTVNKRYIKGQTAVVLFKLHAQTYAIFPLLEHASIALKCDLRDKSALSDELETFLQGYFRRVVTGSSSDSSYTKYNAKNKDFCSLIQVNINTVPVNFEFDSNNDLFFESLGGNQHFDGYEELSRCGYCLDDLYPDNLSIAYYRENIVKQVREVLFEQGTPACLCVIGPHGSGKSTIIENALLSALDDSQGRAQVKLPSIWYIDPLRIISGMSIVGMWQKRLDSMLNVLTGGKKARLKHIAYIDNPVALFRIGKSAHNSLTIADVIKPLLEKRALGMVLETSAEQWEKVQEYDRRFSDLFYVIRVDEPDKLTSIKMLNQVRIDLERRNLCVFEQQAMAEVWRLSSYYSVDKSMPGAAVDVLQQLSANSPEVIKNKDVLALYAQSKHYNPVLLDDKQKLTDSHLYGFLNSRLIGQDIAKKNLCDVIQCVKAKVSDGRKPLSSLLFIGPTGVGKTEAAKVLCEYLFVSQKHLVRFDMNEYIDAGAVSRLIGDEYQPDGRLTSQVRHHNACVLLLDEIEKAHPAVHNLLLQLLGEARLTDVLGRTTDFSQTIVIMTSNLGATQANRQLGFIKSAADKKFAYKEAIQRFFSPEFINRIDRTVVFEQLSEDDIQKISTIIMQNLLKREGLQRRTGFLKINRDALCRVASDAYDPMMGARALKRNIEKSLIAIAAKHLSELPVDQQVILEVGVKNDKLQVLFQPIFYPKQNDFAYLKLNQNDVIDAYLILEKRVEHLLDTVHAEIDKRPEHKIALWSLVEPIRDLQRKVKKVCWDIETWKETPINRGMFTLASSKKLNDWSVLMPKTKAWNKYFQSSIDLSKIIASLTSIAELVHTNYLQHYIDYQSLSLFIKHINDKEVYSYRIELTSLIEHSSKTILSKLSSWYADILRYFAIDVKLDKTCANKISLLISGNRFVEYFAHEQGIHIFNLDSGVSTPVECKFFGPDENEAINSSSTLSVIRYYQILYSGESILDFRSGLYCSRFPTALEYFLIYFTSGCKQVVLDYA